MSFWDEFKDLEKFIQEIKSFFKLDSIQKIAAYDTNPVLTDRAEFENIQMNATLNHYVMLGHPTVQKPANDDSPFSFISSRNAANTGPDHPVNDKVDGLVINSESILKQSKDSFFVSPFEESALHLYVTAEEVLEMGNHIIIGKSEVSMLSFQDDGWIKLENDKAFPEEVENLKGYDTYVHDAGAILQIDERIEIIPPEM